MRKLYVAADLIDPVTPELNRRLEIVLAARYGDDALLAHNWIQDRLRTHGAVELEDDAGRTWHFQLGDLRRFAVKNHWG